MKCRLHVEAIKHVTHVEVDFLARCYKEAWYYGDKDTLIVAMTWYLRLCWVDQRLYPLEYIGKHIDLNGSFPPLSHNLNVGRSQFELKPNGGDVWQWYGLMCCWMQPALAGNDILSHLPVQLPPIHQPIHQVYTQRERKGYRSQSTIVPNVAIHIKSRRCLESTQCSKE